MNIARSAGVLLHPSSLPGPYGIGDLGPEAYDFVDWLVAAGFHYWQVLPLGPTGFGNSPYQCHSVFAGNPSLISPDLMVRDGLLGEAGMQPAHPRHAWDRNASGAVDFGTVIPWKREIIRKARLDFARNPPPSLRSELEAFQQQNRDWLHDFALFMSLKDRHGGTSLLRWPQEARSAATAAAGGLEEELGDAIEHWEFSQWLFHRQWRQLKEYANARGIELIGDAPIFAAMDSADVWSNPELFCLDSQGGPTAVAGVPPDYFAPTGQLWGNPLYAWQQHKGSGYLWWIRRARSLLQMVDLVRLDHFRGFAAYWEIPFDAPTAESGRWVPGPGEDFLDSLLRGLDATPEHPDLRLIAEDLGVATPDVVQLLRAYDLPGMRVLQFGFTGYQDDFLPHNYPVNCVAYTGTHDNDTSRGWFCSATERERRIALQYLRSSEARIVADMIDATWSSQSILAVVPMQDVLDLGSEARMNFPGKPEGYWEWRLAPGALTPALALELRSLNARCDRLIGA